MQICTSLQTDNHASTPPLSFLQAGCPSCHPTNSVKALHRQIEEIDRDTFENLKIYQHLAKSQATVFYLHISGFRPSPTMFR